ncbi:MAG: flagellar biosynthesis protein FlhB, partial [Candidatus Latescibacteria bacterium]|nr:flagellar biosynthesis protein FlhB [Candidatus Latescibacterota bacterium]
TEEPTTRRLEQAREKGQVAKSQEVTHWFMILAAALLIGVFGKSFAGGVTDSLYKFIARPHSIQVDGSSDLRELMFETFGQLGLAILMPVCVILLAAFVAGVIQNGFIFSTETITPKLSKLSLAKGLKRLFSTRSVVEFVKGVLKICIVAAVIVLLLWPEREVIFLVGSMDAVQFMGALQALAVRVLVGVLAIMRVIAAVDYLYQKQQHTKELRMSKQDLKDEFKQSEGDPMIKARLRQIRTERARQRMMQAVPEADVVITNPVRLAVALKYDPQSMKAPSVVAKGERLIAAQIKRIAQEAGVPIIEDKPLARALYKAVEVGMEVPQSLYRAVAEVLAYVFRMKRKV